MMKETAKNGKTNNIRDSKISNKKNKVKVEAWCDQKYLKNEEQFRKNTELI